MNVEGGGMEWYADIRNGVTKETALVGLSLSLHTRHYHIGRFRESFEPVNYIRILCRMG